MEWILLAIGVLFGVWALFNVNAFGRSKARSDLGHAVKSLLVLMDDSGHLSIRARHSPIALRMFREGDDRAASLVLQVPMAEWSQGAETALRTLCDVQDYEASIDREPGAEILCSIRIPAEEDIWSPAAGAAGARVANLVLDALGAARDVRLRFDYVGKRSRRLMDREMALRGEE